MKFSERFSCFFQRFRLASRGVMELRGVPPTSFRGPPPRAKRSAMRTLYKTFRRPR